MGVAVNEFIAYCIKHLADVKCALFIRRFEYLENRAREQDLQLQNMSLEEMDVYWNEAKKMGL